MPIGRFMCAAVRKAAAARQWRNRKKILIKRILPHEGFDAMINKLHA
jgi:hypothetical protein